MKKNVLIVNNTLGDGGAEKVLIDILNRFNFERYNVTLLILENKGVRFNKLNKNVKLKFLYPNIKPKTRLGSKFWNFFKYRTMKHLYWVIYTIYAGFKNEIEIAFLEGEPTRFVSRSLNKNSKKIAWVHTDLERCRPSYINELDKGVYKKFHDIICVSNSSKIAFDKIYSDLDINVNVIYNLIEVEQIKELSNQSIEFNFKHPNIISIGRLTNMKRFDLIIKAHKAILDLGLKHELIILGIGPEYNTLKKLVNELNVSDSVHFLGYIDNPYPYIKKSDLYVMASDFEGLPMVISESIVLGKAIICTDNGGGSELLGNGLYGEIIERGDLESLIKSIFKVLSNNEIKSTLEYKASERSAIFDATLVMNKIYDVLE